MYVLMLRAYFILTYVSVLNFSNLITGVREMVADYGEFPAGFKKSHQNNRSSPRRRVRGNCLVIT